MQGLTIERSVLECVYLCHAKDQLTLSKFGVRAIDTPSTECETVSNHHGQSPCDGDISQTTTTVFLQSGNLVWYNN